MKMRNDTRGFSMVEMMTVLVIFGLVIAAAVPSVSQYIRRDRVREAALGFRSTCMVAQKRAQSTRMEHRVVYDPAAGTYFVERRDGVNWNMISPDTLRMDADITVQGGTDTDPSHHIITFEPLGTVDTGDVPATIRFHNDHSDTTTISLVRTGRMTVTHS